MCSCVYIHIHISTYLHREKETEIERAWFTVTFLESCYHPCISTSLLSDSSRVGPSLSVQHRRQRSLAWAVHTWVRGEHPRLGHCEVRRTQSGEGEGPGSVRDESGPNGTPLWGGSSGHKLGCWPAHQGLESSPSGLPAKWEGTLLASPTQWLHGLEPGQHDKGDSALLPMFSWCPNSFSSCLV